MSKTKIEGVILVSFEYPPRRLSKTSDVVYKLAQFLVKNNIKTWVVTFDDWRSDIDKEKSGVIVHRIPYPIPNNISQLSFIVNLKPSYQSTIATILHVEKIEIIHTFEWQTLPAIIPWKDSLKQQLVHTTTSLQPSRDKTNNPYNNGIKKIEELGLKIQNLILPANKELADILINDYKLSDRNIKIQSIAERKYTINALSNYDNLLNNQGGL
ncbi:MAG: hypothetical protein FK734_04780 [Asgard group archaeon]|nr:hypothetical protein [Asgard group archaeon]